jgi:uncharacterized protein (DUF1778 family)
MAETAKRKSKKGSKTEPETRRKPKDKRREAYLRVRLTAEQDKTIRQAADAAGITISSWAVERLFRAAKSELEAKG